MTNFADEQTQWGELVKELKAAQAKRDAFNPFPQGWAKAESILAWNKYCDAVDQVKRRMDKFLAGLKPL